jgi:ABC-type uncharacterized transport system permease subunit
LALTLFGAGVSAYIGMDYTGDSLQSTEFAVPYLASLPFFGQAFFRFHPMVYLSLLLCGGIIWFLYKTRSGLVLRAVGESPASAHALGYR